MSKIYFTLTGTNHYFGKDFLKKGTKIRLEKEPDNEYDKEAIKVTYEGLGKIGYAANSSYTVLGDSMSAGRIYDKIGKKAKAKLFLLLRANGWDFTSSDVGPFFRGLFWNYTSNHIGGNAYGSQKRIQRSYSR